MVSWCFGFGTVYRTANFRTLSHLNSDATIYFSWHRVRSGPLCLSLAASGEGKMVSVDCRD
jgi:hypothetical protein